MINGPSPVRTVPHNNRLQATRVKPCAPEPERRQAIEIHFTRAFFEVLGSGQTLPKGTKIDSRAFYEASFFIGAVRNAFFNSLLGFPINDSK